MRDFNSRKLLLRHMPRDSLERTQVEVDMTLMSTSMEELELTFVVKNQHLSSLLKESQVAQDSSHPSQRMLVFMAAQLQ